MNNLNLLNATWLFIIALLAVMAIFFGLFPHSYHISILRNMFPKNPIASHTGHIIFGFTFYTLAVLLAQRKIIY
tara:strand:- start:683 stop:904 length:222 start_codon:yes stop_codon:yes gene_type:complete